MVACKHTLRVYLCVCACACCCCTELPSLLAPTRPPPTRPPARACVRACRGKAASADLTKKAVLLSGSPGIGKTSSALIVCRELGYEPIEVRLAGCWLGGGWLGGGRRWVGWWDGLAGGGRVWGAREGRQGRAARRSRRPPTCPWGIFHPSPPILPHLPRCSPTHTHTHTCRLPPTPHRPCTFALQVNASDSRGKSDASVLKGVGGKLANAVKEMSTNTALSVDAQGQRKKVRAPLRPPARPAPPCPRTPQLRAVAAVALTAAAEASQWVLWGVCCIHSRVRVGRGVVEARRPGCGGASAPHDRPPFLWRTLSPLQASLLLM